jgi:hypothetical protein
MTKSLGDPNRVCGAPLWSRRVRAGDDLDGNSAEAVHHGGLRRGGTVDHLWIRVADVAGSKRFYKGIAVEAGLSVVTAFLSA